jgi:hypothetical protein
MLPLPSPLAGEGGEGRSPEPDEGFLFGMNMSVLRTLASIAALLLAAASAGAQPWPTRSMTLVVPFAAGGSSDAIGRIVADGLSGQLGYLRTHNNVSWLRAI